METLVDCLEYWAQAQPEKILFGFLDGRGNCREQYTYQQFYERALSLAQQLAELTALQYGDRVLLVYPPGLELMAAFFATVNLGVIPVPVCAPMSMTSGAGAARIEHIARDCGARLALTTSSYLRGSPDAFTSSRRDLIKTPLLQFIQWLATDTVPEPGGRFARRQTNPVLFLQYTSGSTGDPKGVVVTHRNVLHNARITLQHCPVGVSWLPQYHDMGLIGHHLSMFVLGGTNYGFSPFDFLKRPALWLKTISRVRATLTAAPNFAYGYCLRENKVPDAALCDVDLSSLKIMLNAAEPVHAETHARFYERFSKYGLPWESYQAGYGLAENTIAVSLRGRQTLTVQKQRMQRRQLSIHKARTRNNNQISLVSCGHPLPTLDVRIVDPDSRCDLGEGAIGEIWIDGESKCPGYWEQPELTETVFHARINNDPHADRNYLRTGDLGFLHEGELFVCGRVKDMIIVRGTNYYPQDIEAIVQAAFPHRSPLGPVAAAAFAVEHQGEERLVVLVEARPSHDLVEPAAVAQAIRAHYFIDPYQVAFVPPRSISKTTSGKVARNETRERWLRGAIPVLVSFVHVESERKEAGSLTEILEDVRECYQVGGMEEVTLTDIGLDSLTLVDLTLKIQHHLERRGLTNLASELDARFLQRLTIAELSRLAEAYDVSPEGSETALRPWLEARHLEDNAHELECMRADAQWHPPTDSLEDARDEPQTIFLTGASGFFGPFLLGSLLQRTRCAVDVLTRAADPNHGRARLVEAMRRSAIWTRELQEQVFSRVRVVCGDLGLPRLGLADDQWQRLAEEVDAVVHNGAWVNYVLSYGALRPFNVDGTRELLRLSATERTKPFHLISSTFIHGWRARPIAAEHHYNADMEELDFGYAQTKCVAEHLVRNAERHGHPVRIYRPSLISASSRGIGSKDDIIVRLLAFMIKHGVGVDAANQISFLPADLVSDHIARIFTLKHTPSSTFQVTTTRYYNLMDVTRIIGAQFGYSFTYYSLPRFIEEMNRRCTPDDPLYPLLVFFNRSYRKFKPMEHKRYDNRHYRAALDRVCPDAREPRLSDTVNYIVQHLLRAGLIPPPVRQDALEIAETV